MNRIASDSERPFTARDLRDLVDLSYRQLNDWEAKGVFPPDPSRGAGWRKFTAREVFTLMVCASLRQRFGVSLERLSFICHLMLDAEKDPLVETLEQMVELGVGVWLATDLAEEVVVFPETVFEGPHEAVWFLRDPLGATLLLRLDPMVRRLVHHIDESIHIPLHGKALEDLRAFSRWIRAQTPNELEVLEHIRSGNFTKIEIKMNEGNVTTIRVEESLRNLDRQDLRKLIESHDFQTLKLTTRDGRVVSMTRTLPLPARR